MPDKFDLAAAVLAVLALTLVLLPPRWDPAIRLKEWLERRR